MASGSEGYSGINKGRKARATARQSLTARYNGSNTPF